VHRARALRLALVLAPPAVAGAAWSPGVRSAVAYGKQTLRGVFARLLRGLAARDVLTPP
jgi:hypothetical protein